MTHDTRARSHSQRVDDLDQANARLDAAVSMYRLAVLDRPQSVDYFAEMLHRAVDDLRDTATALTSTHVDDRGGAT